MKRLGIECVKCGGNDFLSMVSAAGQIDLVCNGCGNMIPVALTTGRAYPINGPAAMALYNSAGADTFTDKDALTAIRTDIERQGD